MARRARHPRATCKLRAVDTRVARSSPVIDGTARAFSTRSASFASGSEESTPRITPRVRRCRTSARVSISLMIGNVGLRRGSRRRLRRSASCWRPARTRGRPDLRYTAWRPRCRPRSTVVADLRIGEDDDLAGIGRIGENFLISGDGGIEDNFAVPFRARTKTTALEDCSVFQGEDR